MQKILIATTNIGKFKEIAIELSDLPFKIISLDSIKKRIKQPKESGLTIESNALIKAQYYAKKTGLLTIADDTGLFVDKLQGWPGVLATRIGSNDKQRITKLLERMKKIHNRSASFRTAIAVYDPKKQSSHVEIGEVRGEILRTPAIKQIIRYGYNSIFYVDKAKKTFSEMSIIEKNLLSHRGLAVNKIKNYLSNHYGYKDYIVPAAIIVKNKKMYMAKRRDFRLYYNNKWEFPGGIIDHGETIYKALFREVKEESGYHIKIIEQLPVIVSEVRSKFSYRIFLVTFICKIVGGHLKTSDNEVYESGWFTLEKAKQMKLIPLSKKCIHEKDNQKILLKYIME
ncbi:MAG: RdgB/HAM1 family non-canonical purine NTP pyrophosphatase [bacterium]